MTYGIYVLENFQKNIFRTKFSKSIKCILKHVFFKDFWKKNFKIYNIFRSEFSKTTPHEIVQKRIFQNI